MKGETVKKIFTILLAVILSSMLLIVGNASKPTALKLHLPEQTPQYFPLVYGNVLVTGSVEIEDGVDHIGEWGFWVGDPLDLDVEFWASSQDNKVTYMRACIWYYGIGCSVDDVYQLLWESFVSHKTYTISLVNDFHPLFVHVQYRDDHGNLSRVYTDDIVIVAWPLYTTTAYPTTTATPTITTDPP